MHIVCTSSLYNKQIKIIYSNISIIMERRKKYHKICKCCIYQVFIRLNSQVIIEKLLQFESTNERSFLKHRIHGN